MRKHRNRVHSIVTSFALVALSMGGTVVEAGPLDRRTEQIVTRTDLGGGVVGVYIADLDTGVELADYQGSNSMIPASNMKLLTSGAALFVLGGEFRFQTELILDETTTPPTLVIKGDGDPALGDPAIFIGEQPGVTLDTLFDQISDALKGAGIQELKGILVDDRVLDRNFTHPAWPIDQLNRWYCAQVGGFNFHTNVLDVYTQPAASGGTPIVQLQPEADWVELQVKAKSNKKKRDTAWVARPTKENSFTVYGNVSAKSEIPVSVDNPPLFAGRLFASELNQRSIVVGANHRYSTDSVSLIQPMDRYTASKTVAVITTPIFDVLERTNTDSYNLYAEALIKRIGYEITSDPGSWENGATVVRMLLTEKLGPSAAETTVVADGSGMSRENKVQPKVLVSWMRKLARSDHWELFRDSLATPGNGTMRNRFKGDDLESQLYCKSGYLTGTYALSGVLIHPRSHQRVAFSILLNDVKGGSTKQNAKPLIDSIVGEIDNWMSQKAGSPAMGG
ncbi:MAG: D-alanyl-D-alanine carboxypeptidase/D-alanyl-D-alanine-endopeptidase [Phycisphaerales bacterium]|nr:D-alanyl-D-alanine carboxypeptidase/D-alanyl-D-alanine-endopeptidase [Phycisphaerales bacterium]